MNLFAMMDQLLRDRESLYQTAAEGKDLSRLSGRLLLIFAVTAAIYGASMGGFRWLHPDYFFSDFELTSTSKETATGRIAGVNAVTPSLAH